MEKFNNKENLKRITDVLDLIEKVVSKEKLDSAYHKDEVEKYFLNLLNGKDIINVYQRRDAGVSDEVWQKCLKEFYIYVGLNRDNYDKELY